MDNATRRQLLQRHKSSGFKGSIIDVFRAHDQGIDLIGQYEQMQVANTQQEQQQGLRPQHQAGNTNASMAFPNQPPNASFNTVGMKAPIDMKQFDNRGNLVMSYDKVPPGVTDLKMSSQGGTVIETPTKMQSGGFSTGAPRVPAMSDAEMSLKILQEANAGNPAARRMRSDYGQRMFLEGETDPSTHYMASMDNYAVPLVQEEYIGGPLRYNPNPSPSKADFRFDTPEQANYFAKNYKQASAAKSFNQTGGQVDNTRVATPQPPQYQLNPPPPSPYRDQGTITPDKSSFNAWRDEDSLFENAVEFFDPTGITSWDDARRAYNSMKNRGASIPNLDEGLDMFGAIPLFGRAKLGINLAKGAAKRSKDVVNAAKKGYNYLTKGSDIINRVDAIEDEVGFLDQKQFGGIRKYQTGSFVAESTSRPNYGEQAFLNQLNTAPIQERVLTTNQESQGAITQAPDEDPETMPVYKMLAEPMKALEYWRSDYNRERGIPTQAEWDAFGDRNPYDLATSMYNPAQMAVDYSENGAFATLPGLATADDLIKAAGTFKNYGITNAQEAGQLAYNLRNGRVEGVAEELANAGSVINQGAANAKQFYQDAIPAYSPYTSGSYYLNRLADNTLARHPELAATYKPGMMGSQATINATDDFAERYLTSYRGVRANSPEQAAEYLTSPFGRGNRAFGEGIYSAPNPEAAVQHGNYVGQLLADPQFMRGQDPRYTMGRIDHLRVEGGKHRPGLPSMLGKDNYDQISNALQKGADLNRDVSEILGTSNASSFLASKGYDVPDFRTGFMDDAGQRVQRGTTEGRLKPKIVQMGKASEFRPTVQTIWDDLNSGIDYRDPTQLFFKEQGFKKYGGVRKYQRGEVKKYFSNRIRRK